MGEKEKAGKKNNFAVLIGIFAVGLLIASGSVYFGMQDAGVINVSNAIANSNQEKLENNDTSAPQPIPRKTPNVPNGGLVGQSQTPPPPPPPEEVAEESATSTDDLASSTDAALEDGEDSQAAEEATLDEEVATEEDGTE